MICPQCTKNVMPILPSSQCPECWSHLEENKPGWDDVAVGSFIAGFLSWFACKAVYLYFVGG